MQAPSALLKQLILEHARQCAPEECCGLIVPIGERKLGIGICRNAAENPLREFAIDPDDFARAQDECGEVLGVYHSHPNGRGVFSDEDMVSSESQKLPFLVVAFPADEERQALAGQPEAAHGAILEAFEPRVEWGTYTPRGRVWPLEGRRFLHGIWDCYSLVRDWYAQEMALHLPDFHRDPKWWEKGQNLYLDNFEACGFKRIDRDELRHGDAVLVQVRSAVPNHAAIYLGDGWIIHHPQPYLSGKHPYYSGGGIYVENTTHALRHVSHFRPGDEAL